MQHLFRQSPGVFAFLLAGLVSVDGALGEITRPITERALKRLVPGATVHLNTPIGTVVPIAYDGDGTMVGHAGAVAFYLGSSKDEGRWWVENGKLCHKWRIWFSGRRNCMSLRRAGTRLFWYGDSGKTGTGRLATRSEKRAARKVSEATRRTKKTKHRNVRTATRNLARSGQVSTPAPLAPTPPIRKPQARQLAHAYSGAIPKHFLPRTYRSDSAVSAPDADREARTKIVRRPQPRTTGSIAARPVTSAPARDRARAAHYRVVNVRADDVLNIRQEPSADALILGGIPPGSDGVFKTGACRNAWCPIRYGRRRGWVHKAYLAATGDRRPVARKRSVNRGTTTYRVVRVATNDRLNLRVGPSEHAAVTATLAPRARGIRGTGRCRGNWCPVVHGRRSGWANRYYLNRETVVSEAPQR